MTITWSKVCAVDDILPYSGVTALIGGRQVAVFRLKNEFYAISNYDPFSGACVLSRGIVGDRAGVVKVASPIYKQSFSLVTGECLDDPAIKLAVYPVQVVDDVVYISINTEKESRYTFREVVSQRQPAQQLHSF